jgi:hypothetical protein
MTPWGNLLAGTAADKFTTAASPWGKFDGAAHTLQIAGAICILAAISFALKLPGIRKLIRPLYTKKGILPPEVATGLQDATEVLSGHEQQ